MVGCCVSAATKEDVIAAINATYSVGDTTYRLPQSVINKGVNFLNKKKLTSEQYDKILGTIGSAVALARQAGTTDITKVSKEDLKKGIGLIQQASSAANVDLSELSGKLSSELNSEKRKQQQSNNSNNGNTVSQEKINEKDGKSSNFVSGEVLLSGEVLEENHPSGESSGEATLPMASIEDMMDILHEFVEDPDPEIDATIDRNIKIVFIGLVLILFLLFFIIYLLFKSKWNRIVKYILIVFFVIVSLAILCVLGVGLWQLERIRDVYKMYYLLK